MATVTSFTAARMQEIENNAIVSGEVIDGQLMLTRFDGSVILAGEVEGPPGETGPIGQVSTAQLNAAIAAANTLTDGKVSAAKSVGGLGIVRQTVVTAPQNYALEANTWVDITGSTTTFTPQPDRYYEFQISAAVNSAGVPARVSLGLRLSVSPFDTIVRAAGSIDQTTWLEPLNGSRTILAPGTWNAPRSYKLSMYATVPQEITIRSDQYPAVVTIIDHGTLPKT